MIDSLQHDQNRDRMVVVAVWLIGIGTVFLVKDGLGLSWGEAWPLWVIFFGVASGVSTLLDRRRALGWLWSLWFPVAVAAVGVLLLLSTTGSIIYSPGELVALWPLALIGIGGWFLLGAFFVRPRNLAEEALHIALDGATGADVRVRFGGGELSIGPAEPGTLVSGTFTGGVVHRRLGPGAVELEPYVAGWPFWFDRPLRWNLGLPTEVPVDLRIETGANRSSIDLSALRVRRLNFKTGASATRLRLPASGVTSVRAEAGLAELTIEVPPGVAARIRSTVALGSTSIDESRFAPMVDGWASVDYETAANRVEIDLSGGLGSVRVI